MTKKQRRQQSPSSHSPSPAASGTDIMPIASTLQPPKPRLQPFKGNNDKVTIENFIKLFEQISYFYQWNDSMKILMLGNYLEDSALNWYAEASATDWNILKEQLIERFGFALVEPIIQISKLKYDQNQGMKEYFEEKRRLGTLSRLPEDQIISLMIEGLPAKLRVHFITQKPKSYSEFYRIAKLAEEAMLESESIHRPRFLKTESVKHHSNVKLSHMPKRKPPSPCRICENLGFKNRYHWASDCFNKSTSYKKHENSHKQTQPKSVNKIEESPLEINEDALN